MYRVLFLYIFVLNFCNQVEVGVFVILVCIGGIKFKVVELGYMVIEWKSINLSFCFLMLILDILLVVWFNSILFQRIRFIFRIYYSKWMLINECLF